MICDHPESILLKSCALLDRNFEFLSHILRKILKEGDNIVPSKIES